MNKSGFVKRSRRGFSKDKGLVAETGGHYLIRTRVRTNQ